MKHYIFRTILIIFLSVAGTAGVFSQTADELVDKGTTQLNAKDYTAAMDDFNKAIAITPTYPDAYYMRGHVYYDQQKYSDAIPDFTKAIEIKPDYTDAYYKRAESYYNTGSMDLALSDFSKITELAPAFAFEVAISAFASPKSTKLTSFRIKHLRNAIFVSLFL